MNHTKQHTNMVMKSVRIGEERCMFDAHIAHTNIIHAFVFVLYFFFSSRFLSLTLFVLQLICCCCYFSIFLSTECVGFHFLHFTCSYTNSTNVFMCDPNICPFDVASPFVDLSIVQEKLRCCSCLGKMQKRRAIYNI